MPKARQRSHTAVVCTIRTLSPWRCQETGKRSKFRNHAPTVGRPGLPIRRMQSHDSGVRGHDCTDEGKNRPRPHQPRWMHDDHGKRSRATMLVRSQRQSHSKGSSVEVFAADSCNFGRYQHGVVRKQGIPVNLTTPTMIPNKWFVNHSGGKKLKSLQVHSNCIWRTIVNCFQSGARHRRPPDRVCPHSIKLGRNLS